MVLAHNRGPKSGGGQGGRGAQASGNLEMAPAGSHDPSSSTQLHPGANGQMPGSRTQGPPGVPACTLWETSECPS